MESSHYDRIWITNGVNNKRVKEEDFLIYLEKGWKKGRTFTKKYNKKKKVIMKELRMYGLVNYQLTGIQKGIQFLHGVVEYSQIANRVGGNMLNVYNEWANNHKTVILLNGGTTNDNPDITTGEYKGTLNQHKETLKINGVTVASFYEPDLGDQLTAVVFLVDERVFNKKDYLDFEDWLFENYKDYLNVKGNKNAYQIAQEVMNSKSNYDKEVYQQWVNMIGGEKNVFLRQFLKNFRLA